jgi:hypothetical protein
LRTARPAPVAALAAVASRESWLQVRAGQPEDEGWTRADRLLMRPVLDALVATAAERLAGEHRQARPTVLRTVAAAVLLDHWAWALAVAGAGALAATGHVLDLTPSRVHLRIDGGEINGIAVEHLSEATGESGLREELSAHLARLHDLLTAGPKPLLRRSRRLLHGGIGDAVAAALVRQACGLDHVERTRLLALADRLITEAGTWGAPDWLVVDSAGPPELRTRRRAACCLWYRLPAQTPCLTCPRLTDTGRLIRLHAQASA